MKKHLLNLSLLTLLSAASLCGCSSDDEPIAATTDGTPLTVTVRADGFASTDATPQSRAVEKEYTTQFTRNDAIGVYAVVDGSIKEACENLKLVYDGTDWKPESADAIYKYAGATYFAYYPYKESLSGTLDSSATTAEDFFADVINNWTIQPDQSDYRNYTGSDLMIADAFAGSGSLSFSMKHQMSMVEINLPASGYQFTNTDPVIPAYLYKPIKDVKFTDFIPYAYIPGGTYRYIVKPGDTSDLKGEYTDDDSKIIEYTCQKTGGLSASSYKRYVVDGGGTITKHNLQAGDFFMNDGSLVGKDRTLTTAQKDACIGIVYWLGDIKSDNYGLLDSKFPDGTHGLVVSLWNMPNPDDPNLYGMTWTYGGFGEFVSDWLQNPPCSWSDKPADFSSIKITNKMQGYANTVALEEYNKYVENRDGPDSDKRVKPVYGLPGFETAHPTPDSSSGWYWPSICELQYICWGQGNSSGTSGKKMLNTQINKVDRTTGIIVLSDNYYWPSTEYSGSNFKAWYINFRDGAMSWIGDKDRGTYHVHPILAF